MALARDTVRDVRRSLTGSKQMRDEDATRSLALNERLGYRLPVVFSTNDYLLTKNGAWSGYAIPNKPWGFLDENSRRAYFYQAENVFNRIFPAEKENAGQLLITNRVYSADEWERMLLERYADTATPEFAKYVKYSRQAIERSEFFERECYLFARSGGRGNRDGWRGWVRDLVETYAGGNSGDDSQPDEDEQDFWLQQSNSITDSLSSSWLMAIPIHRRRLEWIVRHLDTPGLPTPDCAPADAQTWGAGEWRTVLSSYTEEVDLGVVGKDRYRCVQFEAPTGGGTTYAAYLPVSHIPNELHFGQNWLHHASALDFPVDGSLRFEVIDPDRAEKDLEKPIFAAEAQEEEDSEAGVRTDDATMQQQQGLRNVKTQVQMGRQPLVYWQCVFAVYDTDKDALLSKVSRLIRHYHDIDFELVCPRNDQRELFYQSMPGSDVLVEDWMNRTDTGYLASAMPWLTSTVGDRDDGHGLYQGYTIVRDSQQVPKKGVPVFFDLQNVVDDMGKAPTEVVAGFPGSGKSVSRGLKVAHEDALRGVTQFVWDPKGDFLPLKRWAARMSLNPDKVKLVDLYDPNNSVSLDAFAIAEVDSKAKIDQRATSARDVLTQLCSQYTAPSAEGRGEYLGVIRAAVGAVMAREVEDGTPPTMRSVLDVLWSFTRGDFSALDRDEYTTKRFEDWRDRAQTLRSHLVSVEQSVLGRLLFRNPEEGTMKITPGDLVIFIAIKMVPTEPNQTPSEESLVSDVISGLMTDFIRSLLFQLDDHVTKAAIFDEWHVIKRSSRAEALLDWMRRMGRSKRCMVRQMSQSAADFDKGSLSTVWCGYAQNDEEAEMSCDLLGIEKSDQNIKLLQAMEAGQFLFKDVLGRVAHVQVDIWDDAMLKWFNTSPAAKERLMHELAEAGETITAGV